jgi:hypothetical protein
MLMQLLLHRPGKRGRTMKLVLPIIRPLRKILTTLLSVWLPVVLLLRPRLLLLPALLLRPRLLLLLPVLKQVSPLMLVLDVVAVNTKQLKDSVIPNMLVHRQMCL